MEPILKWAGGKRWLVRDYAWLFPNIEGRFIEPFLGGAAVFLALGPKKALLSDLNGNLINVYNQIKTDWQGVHRELLALSILHSDKFYYEVRSMRDAADAKSAARFIYLNRTCFNGLYRVNLKGEFNVPRGTKNQVIFGSDDFEGLSSRLSGVDLRVGDFESSIDDAVSGDFVFIDPPYTVAHNENGFLKYNQKIFSWDDQVRLKDAVVRAAGRGVNLLILNADHQSIRDLYSATGTRHEVARLSVISGANRSRGRVTELAIQVGYKIDADLSGGGKSHLPRRLPSAQCEPAESAT